MTKKDTNQKLPSLCSKGMIVFKSSSSFQHKPFPSELLLSRQSLAEKLRCHPKTIERRARKGKLQTFRFTPEIVRYRIPDEKSKVVPLTRLVSRSFLAEKWDLCVATIAKLEPVLGLERQSINDREIGYKPSHVLRAESDALVSA